MGLLDDAIREHLDLKRRRGADPSEVARLEQEALGPVRREPAPAEPADEHHDEPRSPEPAEAEPHPPAHAEHPHPASEDLHPDDRTRVLAPEDRHEAPHGDPLSEQHAHNVETGGAAAHEPEELGGAAASKPEPSAGDADRAAGVAEDDSATPPAESPRAATGPARSSADPEHETQPAKDPRHSDIVDQPTTEYRVEDLHDEHEPHEAPPRQDGPDEDVLEETPDFLQETPEHDRLWFEQRPPRDFDFDG